MEPRRSLFRQEATAQVGHRTHGTVLLARPLSYTLLTIVFVAMAAAIVGFLCVGRYTRRVDVQGVLMPARGLIKVISTQPGLVAESHVAEGQSVRAGDVLFVLNSERQTAGQGNADQVISTLLKARRESLLRDEAQTRLQDSQRLDAARHRAQDIAADILRLDGEAALQARRIEIARANVERYTDLAASHFVSPVQVQDKQGDLLEQQQRLAELQRTHAATTRDLATAQAEVRDLAVQATRDEQAGERNVSATEQDLTENEARRQILVRAPGAGVVTAITVEPGQSVTGNQALASVLPAGSELEAQLYAPTRAVGFLRTGMVVQLRFNAYSFQKFGQAPGHIREISRVAVPADELGTVGAASNEPVYRVRVALDRQSIPAYGVEQPLRAGATLEGSIPLDTRRLYEWMLEPLYTITGHL